MSEAPDDEVIITGECMGTTIKRKVEEGGL